MRQHLDTIPVWEAYQSGCECPLCHLEARNDAIYVDNFLGGSVMEPSVRIEVNKKGFCAPHLRALYDKKNRLGLALMEHTHLMECIQKIEAQSFEKKSLFARKDAPATDLISQGCIICERLENTLYRYALTLCYMWHHEQAFKEALSKSKGFCNPHYALMQKAALEELSGGPLSELQRELKRVQLENLRRIEKEIEWFTLKFDYRNQDKPWGTSEDAVERTANKLRTRAIRNEEPPSPPKY